MGFVQLYFPETCFLSPSEQGGSGRERMPRSRAAALWLLLVSVNRWWGDLFANVHLLGERTLMTQVLKAVLKVINNKGGLCPPSHTRICLPCRTC